MSAAPPSAAIEIHAGASGMGKTFTAAKIVEAHALRKQSPWLAIVADPNSEWHIQSKHGAIVRGSKSADAARKAGHRILDWQPPQSGDELDMESLCAYALSAGPGTILFAPEAHLHWPLMRRPTPAAVRVLTGYRHACMKVILDTQRLASLSMMARNNARVIRVFGTVGHYDLSELRAIDPALEAAARECAARTGRGQPGYFAEYDSTRGGGPYPLRRLGGR